MRASRLSGAVLILVVVGGCTTTRTVSFIPSGGEVVRAEAGAAPWIQSAKIHTVTVWLLDPEYRVAHGEFNPLMIRVEVANRGDRPFVLSPADIAASAGAAAVHVVTADEYRAELRRQEQALLHAVDARAAQTLGGQESLRQYVSATAPQTNRGAGGETMYDSSWQETEARSSVAARVEGDAAAERAAIHRRFDGMFDRVRLVLAPVTVAPGAAAGGIVMLEPRRLDADQPLKLVVRTDGETHEFLFRIKS